MKIFLPAVHSTANKTIVQNLATFYSEEAKALSLSFFFRVMMGLFFFASLPMKAHAQCPVTTYSVGSDASPSYPTLSSAPAGVANLTTGQSIKVSGTFTVDQPSWNISGANVYLTSSTSEIIVNDTSTLNASSSAIFQGCNTTYKWLAVRVLQGGTINADACTFTGGLNAVNIAGPAAFTLTGNTFTANTNCLRITGQQTVANHTVTNNTFSNSVTGLYFTGRNVTLGFNTFTNTGIPNMTGVFVNAGQYLLIDDGSMVNLSRGLEIAPIPGSQCIEMNSVVFSGSTAVYAEQGKYSLNIHDCTFRATKTAIDIKNHITAFPVPIGTLCGGNITIVRNTISTMTESGVRIANTNGKGRIEVLNNTVMSEIASTGSFTYYGIQITNALNARVFVENNTVVNQGNTQPTVPGGIYLLNCKNESSVSYNTVKAGQFGGFGDLQFGINVVGSPHITAKNNNVDGGPNIMDRAIGIENPVTDIDLCCNTMTRSTKGLYMLGAHEDCIIQTSIFGAHTEALYYDMVMSTSAPQIHRGNNWSGAATAWDGYYNGNSFFAATVKYQVDPSLLPNLLSKIFVTGGNASDWFSTPSAAELPCHSVCGNGFTGEGGSLTGNDYWAMNALADPTYATLHWIAKRNLYTKLLAYPALLQDAQASAFFSAAQNGNIGKFHNIEVGIASLYDPELTADPVQKLVELQTLNASIVTEAAYQANEKTINTLHLAALAQDDWDFSESEKATIDGVAALCPQAAGNAVYTARYLQENYRVPYWNMDCAFVGARDGEISNKAKSFAVFPNPASDALNITFAEPVPDGSTVELLSMTGQALYTQSLAEGLTSITIPVNSLSNGYYLIRLSGKGEQPSFQKVTIIR